MTQLTLVGEGDERIVAHRAIAAARRGAAPPLVGAFARTALIAAQ